VDEKIVEEMKEEKVKWGKEKKYSKRRSQRKRNRKRSRRKS
jgi:hypothetical protein